MGYAEKINSFIVLPLRVEENEWKDLPKALYTNRSSEIYVWNQDILLKLFHQHIEPDLILNEQINTVEAFEKCVTAVQC